jgi:Domain of unknown function (DUF4440)
MRLLSVVMLLIGTWYPMSGATVRALGGAWRAPISADTLFSEIATQDSALFTAFNERKLEAMSQFFAPDLEFYQDNEGVESYAQTVSDFAAMFKQPSAIRRRLVPGSMQVYPIKNYGAIQVGEHQFCHVENGKDDCGTFKFLHIWRKAHDRWQITRAISYGH